MDYKIKKYNDIDESLYSYEHRSGLKAFVIPKKGYHKKYATFSTHYGSINNEFVIPGGNEPTSVPDGIAHFLEHKLFEQKDGSVMNKFSKLGSNPNAYTGFNQTVYLFSCTDRFEDNFGLLLDYVQNPYITEESVEKEKGIIGQEIKMYQDDPGWRAFFNFLGALYEKNPVRIDIAGTVESIGKIDRDALYTCYNTFYHPSNMAVLVVGDVDPESVFKQIDQSISIKSPKGEIKRIFPSEPAGIHRAYVEQRLAVAMPLFQAGFREDGAVGTGIEGARHEIAVKLLLEMIMGRSSDLYEELYGKGLINSSFDHDYTMEENYAFSMFGGESPEPEKVRDIIIAKIEEIKRSGLDRNGFERTKKAMHGRFIRSMNSVERISHSFISVYFKGVYLFDYLQVYDKITFEYVTEVFNRHFIAQKLALSVIKPVQQD